jgi:hypothetical protein
MGRGGIKSQLFEPCLPFLLHFDKMSDNQTSTSKPPEDNDSLAELHDYHNTVARAMAAAQAGELNDQLQAAASLGSLAASALLNDQKQKPAEEVIIRLPVDGGIMEPEDDDITFLDESSKRIGFPWAHTQCIFTQKSQRRS